MCLLCTLSLAKEHATGAEHSRERVKQGGCRHVSCMATGDGSVAPGKAAMKA